MKNFSFGQYYPVNSPIHSLDPRTKILLALIYIVSSFLCKNVLSFAMLLLSVLVLVILSNIKLSILIKSIRPLIFVFIFSFFINLFLTRGETLLVSWGIIQIYKEGLVDALLITVRILVLVLGASIFMTYTTTPIALTDGIESLLSPLSKMGVQNVHYFAMMMSIALRFIPTLMDETHKIMSAQKSRGADFESGGLIKRAKAMIPILIPLFASAVHRGIELATAMECRCYHGGKGRTKFRILKFGINDLIAFIIVVIFVAGIIVLNKLGLFYDFSR